MVCARHGEPEIMRRKVKFRSKRPDWLYPLIAVGVILFVLIDIAIRDTLVVAGWPFCAQCRKLRLQRILSGIGLVTLGVAFIVVNAIVGLPGPVKDLGPLSIFVIVAGIIVWALSPWSVIGRAHVSKDAGWLEVTLPHPAFASRVHAVNAHAAQSAQSAAQSIQP
jgi:hypothetical protein